MNTHYNLASDHEVEDHMNMVFDDSLKRFAPALKEYQKQFEAKRSGKKDKHRDEL